MTTKNGFFVIEKLIYHKRYNQDNQDKKEELNDWYSKIETALTVVSREYREETAKEWYSFSLKKDGFKGSDWELEDNNVLVWDKNKNTVIRVNLENKSSEVVVLIYLQVKIFAIRLLKSGS